MTELKQLPCFALREVWPQVDPGAAKMSMTMQVKLSVSAQFNNTI
jgi:hypothetical protein